MHSELFTAGIMSVGRWQMVGFLGAALFSGRWIVQAVISYKAGRPVVSRSFWLMSISGNALILAYFIFGKPDLVGIVSNSFPMALAGYNLWLLRNDSKESLQSRTK